MPKNGKQILGVVVVGGIAAMAAGLTQNVSKQTTGPGGFAASTIGGALGAALALVLLAGAGVKLA